jgi:hypothetical protein
METMIIILVSSDYEPSPTNKEHDSYGLSAPSNFYVNKKLSEFLGNNFFENITELNDFELIYKLTDRRAWKETFR